MRPDLVLEDEERELGLQVVEDAEGQAEQTPLHLRWVSRDVVMKFCVFEGELHLDVGGALRRDRDQSIIIDRTKDNPYIFISPANSSILAHAITFNLQHFHCGEN